MANYLSYVEELFIMADEALNTGNIPKGKKLLENILAIEPGYGRAHNHLGWIYANKLNDFVTAEMHYKLAVKFSPDYAAGYLNYGHLLTESNRLTEANEMYDLALNVGGADLGMVYDRLATVAELNKDYKLTISYLEKAKDRALNEGFLDYVEASINRVKRKMSTWTKITMMMF